MKRLFKVSLVAVVFLLIWASPKAFADFKSWGDKYPSYDQGNHGNQGNQGGHGDDFGENEHKQPKCPVAPEPLNAALFLTGAATLAFVVYRKKLLAA